MRFAEGSDEGGTLIFVVALSRGKCCRFTVIAQFIGVDGGGGRGGFRGDAGGGGWGRGEN